MPTRRLADRQIRAAQQAAPGLDVRGPVSRALGEITVPLADEKVETEAAVATPAPPAPSRPARRQTVPAAQRVLKPFADAPWPTRKPRPAGPEPPAVLSGLTADERRVHRILLDTLAIDNARDGVSGGLTYAEKKRLPALDLDFIDAEIAKMASRPSLGALRWVLAALLVGVAVPFALYAGETPWEAAFYLVLVAVMAAIPVLQRDQLGSGPQRLAIYRALRELALLANPGVTSDALAQADAVIDRLAGAPGAAAAGHTPRLSLDTETPTPTTSASRTRARS